MPAFLDKIKRKLSNMGSSKSAETQEKSSTPKAKRPPSPMPRKAERGDNPDSEQRFTIQPHPAASTFKSCINSLGLTSRFQWQKTNDPADLQQPTQPGGGLATSNPMLAFQTPGPVIPDDDIKHSIAQQPVLVGPLFGASGGLLTGLWSCLQTPEEVKAATAELNK